MSRKSPLVFSLLLGAVAIAAAAADGVPVIFAVDASRSLSTRDLAMAAESVVATAAALPPETSRGLLVFADQPRWLARPVAGADLAAAAGGLRPEGNYTLLHDALFAAMEELPRGGIVVLLTDGRDENSATTMDDLARRAGERGVRIVALGVGRAQDERTLRRLAVVSGGSYAGRLGTVAPADLAATLTATAAQIAAARSESPARAAAPIDSSAVATPRVEKAAEPAAPAAPVAPPDSTPATAAAPAPGPGLPAWLWPALAVAILAAAAIGFLLRRGRAPRAAECPRCGTALLPGESGECAACRESTLVERLRTRPAAGPDHAIDAFLDTASVPQLSLEERLERTLVMLEQPTLVVQEHGEPPRSFALPADKAFSIGREPGRNTLAIPSVALSAEHFRIVPEGDAYYLLDLKSTNGTALNGKRVHASRLTPGDTIAAGQVDFQFQVQQVHGPRRRPSPARIAS